MNKLPRLFSARKQTNCMDQSLETPSPSNRPKLVRRNAVKNFDYYPSSSLPSSSVISSTTSESSAPRTRSLDLNISSDRSLQIKGNDGQLSQVCESLGLSGPEDFEIPKAVWEMFRISSDVIQQRKSSLWDEDERDHLQQLEAPIKTVVELSQEFPSSVQSTTAEANSVLEQPWSLNGIVGRGILGNRPPVLTLPTVTSLHGADDCSSQVTVEELTESIVGRGIIGDRPPILSLPSVTPLPGVVEGSSEDIEEALAPKDVGETDLYPIVRPVNLVKSVRSVRSSLFRELNNSNGNIGARSPNAVAVLSSDDSCSTSQELDSSSSSTDNSPIIKVKFNITNWQKGNRLGQGSFGTVYEGISSDGMFFAVKEVSLLEQGSQGKESILSLQQEIELLSDFQHKNIVQYLGTATDDANLYIFLELVTKGSLASLYRIYVFPDSVVAAYTRQILSGLKYLHSRKVVHRDIKCANILVASTGTVKLADFGLAKTVKLNDLKSCKGTALWMAPEVVNNKNQGYGTAADIWSLGCTVLEMSTGQLPYHPLDSMQALFRIGMGRPPPIPDHLSADLRSFISRCLQVNPDARPSAAELLDDPFLKRRSSISLGTESPATGRWPGR